MTDTERGAIGFAEKVLELLEEGRYVATYKYAVLLALMDLCLERTQASGIPPQTVTTRQIADKIIEIYWPHTLPFIAQASRDVLRQNAGGQAEVVSAIVRFREQHAPDPTVPRWQARAGAPDAYERLVRKVEWKLIEMPLPRLQTMGPAQHPFIYEINWNHETSRREVTRYQAGDASTFDNRVSLRPHVAEYFLQLNVVLRPLIQRRWAMMVAQLNHLEESQLERFLFGADRAQTGKIRAGLWEIQGRRCFYCERRIVDLTHADVDHFIPWSRYPDDSLDNFVVADRACNGFKSNSLAASEHLEIWARRLSPGSSEHAQLLDLAIRTRWDREATRSLSVARAIYLRLPGDAMLWQKQRDFVTPDRAVISTALQIANA
jgi:5-methylcytosine-specific restriction endonuclease McrA